MAEPDILWTPSAETIESASATQFARQMVRKHRLDLNSYPDFYRWTVDNPETFWSEVWDFCGVIASKKGSTVLVDGDRMPGAKWFPEARLNFAENLMRRGDRGDAFIPNIPEAGMLALAALSQGIVWASCSPDFGVDGVLERFSQIEPKVLFCADGYIYNGEAHDSLERVGQIAEGLKSLRKVVVVPHLNPRVEVDDVPKGVRLDEWLRRYTPAPIEFAQLPFNHPVFILFTSGTTGKPKCITHGAGGTLLQALKTFKFHFDVRAGDRY